MAQTVTGSKASVKVPPILGLWTQSGPLAGEPSDTNAPVPTLAVQAWAMERIGYPDLPSGTRRIGLGDLGFSAPEVDQTIGWAAVYADVPARTTGSRFYRQRVQRQVYSRIVEGEVDDIVDQTKTEVVSFSATTGVLTIDTAGSVPNWGLYDVFKAWYGYSGYVAAHPPAGDPYYSEEEMGDLLDAFVADCLVESTASHTSEVVEFYYEFMEFGAIELSWRSYRHEITLSDEDTLVDCQARAAALVASLPDAAWDSPPGVGYSAVGNGLSLRTVGGTAARTGEPLLPRAVLEGALSFRPNTGPSEPRLDALLQPDARGGPGAWAIRYRHTITTTGAPTGTSWEHHHRAKVYTALRSALPLLNRITWLGGGTAGTVTAQVTTLLEWIGPEVLPRDRPEPAPEEEDPPPYNPADPADSGWAEAPWVRYPLSTSGVPQTLATRSLPSSLSLDFNEALPIQERWFHVRLVALDGRTGWTAKLRLVSVVSGTTFRDVDLPETDDVEAGASVGDPAVFAPEAVIAGEAAPAPTGKGWNLSRLVEVVDPDGVTVINAAGTVLVPLSGRLAIEVRMRTGLRLRFKAPGGTLRGEKRLTVVRTFAQPTMAVEGPQHAGASPLVKDLPPLVSLVYTEVYERRRPWPERIVRTAAGAVSANSLGTLAPTWMPTAATLAVDGGEPFAVDQTFWFQNLAGFQQWWPGSGVGAGTGAVEAPPGGLGTYDETIEPTSIERVGDTTNFNIGYFLLGTYDPVSIDGVVLEGGPPIQSQDPTHSTRVPLDEATEDSDAVTATAARQSATLYATPWAKLAVVDPTKVLVITAGWAKWSEEE